MAEYVWGCNSGDFVIHRDAERLKQDNGKMNHSFCVHEIINHLSTRLYDDIMKMSLQVCS